VSEEVKPATDEEIADTADRAKRVTGIGSVRALKLIARINAERALNAALEALPISRAAKLMNEENEKLFAENSRMRALNAEMLAALNRASQLASRAVDWDLGTDGEIEMDDKTWVACSDLRDEFDAIIRKAKAEGKSQRCRNCGCSPCAPTCVVADPVGKASDFLPDSNKNC